MAFRTFDTYLATGGIIGNASNPSITAVVRPEEQNSDYESGIARIGNEIWHIRTARNTPTKIGAFVAFWQRDEDGKTVPFTDDDPAAGLLVFVEEPDQNNGTVRRGVFQFTTGHLARLGVIAGQLPGKRGFRVYPAWCTGLTAQAATTQRAQAPAFSEY